MLRLSNIRIIPEKDIDLSENALKKILAKKLKLSEKEIIRAFISKKSVDARNKNDVYYNLSIDFTAKKEVCSRLLKRKEISEVYQKEYSIPEVASDNRPVVIGFGPAGMFCALVLAKAGLKPIVLERGEAVEERRKSVSEFWEGGKFNPESNVQFGEGGAGTFSDGKLTTGTKDFRQSFILGELVSFGAPEEILYLAKPHIGTDRLIEAVRNLRNEIISLGGEVRFCNKVIDIKKGDKEKLLLSVKAKDEVYPLETDSVCLAIGHSARDTFEMLLENGIEIKQKPFSVGVRIEHKQKDISMAQYGSFFDKLPPADYKLAVHLENGRGVYTFCMCPGGYVVAANSEAEQVVTNGMSYFDRAGENANAALLVGVNPSDFGSSDPLAGVQFQRELEKKAYIAGGRSYKAPIQTVGDFLKGNATTQTASVSPTYRPGTTACSLNEIFPEYICNSLKEGIIQMGKKIKGFDNADAVLTAVESRSSSPVKIPRNENLECDCLKGLFPCGEGCGYAGGIISSAVDGIKVAEAIINRYLDQ